MAEPKTKRTGEDVGAFLDAIPDERKRADAQWVCALMSEATGHAPEMWTGGMVGFGTYDYRYASGTTGTWFPIGFAPRKQNLTLYVLNGFDGTSDLLARLGKHKTGVVCLYVKRLSDVDLDVLKQIVTRSVEYHRRQH